MNRNFYPIPLSPEEVQRRLAMQRNAQQGQGQGVGMAGLAHAMPFPAVDGLPLAGDDALGGLEGGMEGGMEGGAEDVRDPQQRRRAPNPFADPLSPQNTAGRRLSMMDLEYTNPSDPFTGFQLGGMGAPQGAVTDLGGYASGPALPGSPETYSQQGLMTMPGQGEFVTLSPDATALSAFSDMDMGALGADPVSMSLFNSPDLGTQYPPTTLDTVNPDFAMDLSVENAPLNIPSSIHPMPGFSLSDASDAMGIGNAFDAVPMPVQQQQRRQRQRQQQQQQQEPAGLMPDSGISRYRAGMAPPDQQHEAPAPFPTSESFRSPASTTSSRAKSHSSGGRSSTAGATPTSTTAPPLPLVAAGPAAPRDPKKDVYSKSGFDMLRALWYVATRKNPTVEIGAVDMSCSFVVCDVTLNDCPIIYVSDNFQNLTGYNRHEIVGQNCRFLQSPDGKVEAGTRREFVANDAVLKLRNAIAEGREIQQSLINYRKGGKPFLNLLTMIPIPWDTEDIRYFIGFQIDLVECPDAISGHKSGSGAMQVNYRHSDIAQYIWTPPSSTQWETNGSGQTLTVDEVSALIEQHAHNPLAARSEWHLQSWDKMLLENADDVVHVLSLKGLFLYLSPACKKILEYDTADLVGASLSSVCHPSDIVPVTRELKDAQQNGPVNVAFRIRRKHSGYMWFESYGTLMYEQAKGRKYLILVGRRRPVLSLRRRDLVAASAAAAIGVEGGGDAAAAATAAAAAAAIGNDCDIWAKVSTSGLFLYVSSGAKALLDLPPRELEGTSMQELLRREARSEFGRVMEKARKGAIVAIRHEVLHKKGQFVPAWTVLYPGDGGGASGRAKPSFLIARIRVVKGAAARVIAGGGGGGSGGGRLGLGGGGVFGEESTAVVPASEVPTSYPPRFSGAEDEVNELRGEGDGDGDGDGDDDNIFAELKTTRCTSWQYELRQMEKVNRLLAEELAQLMASKKKRKRRKGGAGAGGSSGGGTAGGGAVVRDCANCHKRDTPEWRRGPSGNRDLCNSCGLRWAKQTGKVSPRNASRAGSGDGSSVGKRASVSTTSTNSPSESSPLRREVSSDSASVGSAAERSSSGEGGGGGTDMGSIREE